MLVLVTMANTLNESAKVVPFTRFDPSVDG